MRVAGQSFFLMSALLSVLLFSACPVLAQPATTPDAARLSQMGYQAWSQGKTQQAIELFQQAVQVNPNYSEAYYNLGAAYYSNKQYPPALDAFQRATQLNPADNQARYYLGLTLDKLNRSADAVAELERIPASDAQYNKAQARLLDLRGKLGQQQTSARPAATAAAATSKPTTSATQSPQANRPATTPPQAVNKPAPSAAPPKVDVLARDLAGPTGMAIGPGGLLYVANYSKNAIVKVLPSGQKSVLVENQGLSGPIGLVIDPNSGNLYVANYLKNNIARVTPAGKVTIVASGLNKPYNLLFDPLSNTLFVTEQETNTVSRIRL
jgi:hypothetical protein